MPADKYVIKFIRIRKYVLIMSMDYWSLEEYDNVAAVKIFVLKLLSILRDLKDRYIYEKLYSFCFYCKTSLYLTGNPLI